MSGQKKRTRRDFLCLATGVVGGAGLAAAAWPFIDQLRPDGRVEAQGAVDVDISHLERGMSVTVKWRGQPVVIRNRTEKEIKAARETLLDDLKDRYARNANLPDSAQATDAARSAGKGRENWLVFINICTHLGCTTLGETGRYKGWFCPCHGSHYDTAGRIRSGPASRNLAVPPYAFVTETLLRIG
ncbi:MAG: Ubiquinol-cytochrome c reductase iron-sulfur subunit [Candidatus Tokpelaia hoelldobleri]|uniref:Ubiquinol-cytochrome c reductase iron-sulfur subunit n=1 Tax=Candidatus Tokpelaia hoelldobleri TaxID=1902579 RepID=A0A1U9JVN0_9HYPH|nr:MAG: Ubiquinol-cytochrome c reductase iron-sulfur subunit [Candidatus Tokpelaia hoelldoblerii]